MPQGDGGWAQGAWGRGTGSGVVCGPLGREMDVAGAVTRDGGLDLTCLACNLPEKALAFVFTSTMGVEYTPC